MVDFPVSPSLTLLLVRTEDGINMLFSVKSPAPDGGNSQVILQFTEKGARNLAQVIPQLLVGKVGSKVVLGPPQPPEQKA